MHPPQALRMLCPVTSALPRCTVGVCTCACACAVAQDVCEQPKEVGPCDAAMTRWYYDHSTQKCLQFLYGGCGGNNNRFETESACQKRCGVCLLCRLEVHGAELTGGVARSAHGRPQVRQRHMGTSTRIPNRPLRSILPPTDPNSKSDWTEVSRSHHTNPNPNPGPNSNITSRHAKLPQTDFLRRCWRSCEQAQVLTWALAKALMVVMASGLSPTTTPISTHHPGWCKCCMRGRTYSTHILDIGRWDGGVLARSHGIVFSSAAGGAHWPIAMGWGGGETHDAPATRRTKRWKGQVLGCDPASGHCATQELPLGRVPTAGMGVSAWMQLANGEG